MILFSSWSYLSRGEYAAEDYWKKSTPSAQGMNPELISKAIKKAGEHSFINSLLIIRNGYLITERYFNDNNMYTPQNIKSVSKSIISALIGIAIKENYLKNVDQKVLDFFPEYSSGINDRRIRDITIKHLLTMSSGFDNTVNAAMDIYSSLNWCKTILRLPVKTYPGEEFEYSSSNTHLLSAIITKAAGMNTLEFAKKYLFDKLNISIKNWEKAPEGYYIGGSEIYIYPRDLAKFGYLYLNNGMFEGNQIIPAAWVKESLNSDQNSTNFCDDNETTYGYSWWLLNINNYKTHLALGFGGQMIMLVQELDMVIIVASDENVCSSQSIEQTNTILDLISDYIITCCTS
ncbi:serine hydrolase domain-containing protein [candidate division KSB1 bacterium]